jgi:hypothetical protein
MLYSSKILKTRPSPPKKFSTPPLTHICINRPPPVVLHKLFVVVQTYKFVKFLVIIIIICLLFIFSVFLMFYYILFFGFLILSVIIADPNQPLNDANIYAPPPPPPYNYYGYQQAQSRQQLQTPSPYLNKRNPNNDAYSNSQQSSYGTASTRPSANQCKLHINCPSKKNEENSSSII